MCGYDEYYYWERQRENGQRVSESAEFVNWLAEKLSPPSPAAEPAEPAEPAEKEKTPA